MKETAMEEIDNLNETVPPMRGMELVARSSIHSLRPPSIVSSSTSDNSEAHIWKLTDLRKRFKNKNLETLYVRYQQRLMHVDLKGFLLLQIFLSFVFILTFLCLNTDDERRAVPEIIGQTILLLTAGLCYGVAYREKPFKKYQFLYMVMAVALAFVLVAVDLGLDFWFANRNKTNPNEDKSTDLFVTEFIFHVPAALYTILAVYNLLPIASLRVTMLIGFSVSIVHLIATALLFHTRSSVNKEIDISLIIADVAFYLTANCFGIFAKCLNEMTLRRAFLDRRRCIESTIKLDYEKSQEEQLMLSILPKHIADDVGTKMREAVQQIRKRENTTPPSRKPFDTPLQMNSDVSVLYADIVNFTPLTTTLSAGSLVFMLNELFGKFDEAARENNCLRIKILGDCYYCVSGIPDSIPAHAKNCVEMGFKMIEIIRQVREDHQVDVDMRIGVHSGSVISGVIGLRKWQFDIWSRDVIIANHMEQSGIAGCVHISMATKNLLGDSYKFEPGNGMRRDPYLAKLGIETFLIVSTDASQSKDGEIKKIKFKADPFATLPRMNNTNDDITIEGASNNHRVNFETNSKPLNETDSSSLDSLYEKLPPSLPVMINQRTPLTSSLPHIYSWQKGRQVLLTSGDEQPEEIYIRLVKNGRKSSATSGTGRRLIAKRRSTTGENTARRGAVLMDNTLVSFRRMMDQADSKMEKAIESMRLSKVKSSKNPNEHLDVNLFLFFSNGSWEGPFLQRPDPLFNLYILGAIPVLIGIMTIQLALYSSGEPRLFWWVFGVALIVLVLVGICLWVPQFWQRSRNSIINDPENFENLASDSPEPSRSNSTVSAAFFKIDSLCSSLTARILIFLLVTVAVGACGLVDLEIVINSKNFTLQAIEQNVTLTGLCVFGDPRIYLWYFTYICSLTMFVAFGFYRIHFLLKFSFYVAALATYTVILTIHIYPDICSIIYSQEDCLLCRASPSIQPELSHALYLFSILLVLHVADRQIEFIYRLDYVWQRQLDSEQEEANTTRIVNKVLLENILPLHVAEVYLDTSRCGEQLYHEEHKRVAVMFASIPNFLDHYAENDTNDGGKQSMDCIIALNKIICAFDEERFSCIEKIKIVGSTYMAASGLTSIRNGSTETVTESESRVTSLINMIKFASAMSTVLEQLNRKESHNFRLRIGIEYGPVIAGVVGAQKPLYDIWGDTVNMASRLEYTSQLGDIQVTEKTAKLLQASEIYCEKRGETFLKGKGLVMTYWVRPDDSVRGSSSAVKSFLGLNDMLIPPSTRNSLSHKPNRPSVLFEEDEEDSLSHRDFQHVPAVVANTTCTPSPSMKLEICTFIEPKKSPIKEDVHLQEINFYVEEELTYL